MWWRLSVARRRRERERERVLDGEAETRTVRIGTRARAPFPGDALNLGQREQPGAAGHGRRPGWHGRMTHPVSALRRCVAAHLGRRRRHDSSQPASQPASQPTRRQRRRRGGPGSTAGLTVRGLQLAPCGSRSRWVGGCHWSTALRLLALRRCRWALSDQIRKVRSKCIGDRRRERGPHSTFCRCSVRVRIHYAALPPSSPPPPLPAVPTRLPPCCPRLSSPRSRRCGRCLWIYRCLGPLG